MIVEVIAPNGSHLMTFYISEDKELQKFNLTKADSQRIIEVLSEPVEPNRLEVAEPIIDWSEEIFWITFGIAIFSLLIFVLITSK